MNKNTKTDRPAARPLFISELDSVAGGRRRRPHNPEPDDGPVFTTRSSMEQGGASE